MIDSYPTVDFSESLIEISKQKPPLPQKPNAPIKPSEPIYKSESGGCLSQLLTSVMVFTGLIVIIAIFTGQIEAILLFGGICGVSFFIIYLVANSETKKDQENRNRGKQYYENNKQYDKNLLTYKKNLEVYENQIKILSSVEYIAKYKNELLEKQHFQDEQLFRDLSRTKLAITNAAISFFAPFLSQRFTNENVLQMVVLENFFLHFIIFNNSGIIINIEINEPYFDNTGIPKNSINNIRENNYSKISSFRKRNITTIRFAEEQIFKYPNECIEFISKVNEMLLENRTHIINIEFPYKLPMWTEEQAHSMAFMRYRNSYIPEKYHELLKFESLYKG